MKRKEPYLELELFVSTILIFAAILFIYNKPVYKIGDTCNL